MNLFNSSIFLFFLIAISNVFSFVNAGFKHKFDNGVTVGGNVDIKDWKVDGGRVGVTIPFKKRKWSKASFKEISYFYYIFYLKTIFFNYYIFIQIIILLIKIN